MPVSKGMPLGLFGVNIQITRWCEQEMEILCGLKVPQRPCRHLFIHKPVSVLRVSNATITLSDMGMIKTCYQM